MSDATGTTVTVKLGAKSADTDRTDCEFTTSGTTITFAGYRQAYQEVEEDSESEEKEALLPPMKVGDKVQIDKYLANGHETTPPARYTEPTLVKKLEELGIGRPSTYAAILGTILNRGYVWKKGQAIVPSWTAFAVVKLMRNHFTELVDYKFTATVEEELDEIAEGLRVKEVWLGEFYYGNGKELPGLKPLVEHNIANIDAAALNAFPVGKHPTTGEEIVLRPGKFGPYVKCGENTASVPETLTPDELNIDIAVALLAAPKYIDPIGELDGLPVFLKNGRYGPYVQWGTIENPPPDFEKPKMVSLFKSMALENVTMNEAVQLLSLPRTVGADTTDGELITAQNGRYGPYISKGKESRTLESEDQIFTITIEAALAKLAEPRVFGRRGPAKPPLKEFGNDPVSNRPVVAKDGKFGTYITDGETNASLTRGDRLEFVTPERAFELLAIRRDYMSTNGGKKPAKRGAKKVAKSPSKKPATKAVAKPGAKAATKSKKKTAKTANAVDKTAE
jgi:DNA topoisomerase-1